jgi:dihydrodipicolinate synthase/N-acetylneuraminate lyase
MAKQSAAPHREILEAALHGLEAQKQRLDDQIAQVRSMLGGRTAKPIKAAGWLGNATNGVPRKRILSPEARQRIAAAQKKRWAAYRKNRG